MSRGSVEPSWRKPTGALGIIVLVLVWVVLIATFSAEIGALPILVQLPLYLVLGILWILPLKPLLRWMETGRWRA
ncbi:MAG: DUF2842 domain-containing protein [Sphingomonas sp.]